MQPVPSGASATTPTRILGQSCATPLKLVGINGACSTLKAAPTWKSAASRSPTADCVHNHSNSGARCGIGDAWSRAGLYASASRNVWLHGLDIHGIHRLVQEHWPTFLERAEEQGGQPRFVVRDFEEYLRCGVLEHGLVHLACVRCGHPMVVAFSCKASGVLPLVPRPPHGGTRRSPGRRGAAGVRRFASGSAHCPGRCTACSPSTAPSAPRTRSSAR